MKSWIQEISEKYIEQRIFIRKDLHEDYIKLNENEKFNLLMSNVVLHLQEELKTICGIDYNSLNKTQLNSIFNILLKEASNSFNAGNAMGGDGGDADSSTSFENGEEKPQKPRKPRAPRTRAQKDKRNAAERAKRAKAKKEKASATGGDGGSAKGGTVGNVSQNAADITGNDNVSVQGTGNVTTVDNRRVRSTRRVDRSDRRRITINYGGSNNSSSGGGQKPVYRVERKLKSVIGPITRAIGVARGVGSGLDSMFGGAGGVLKGAEQIGTSLTPRTLRQRQNAAIFANLNPQQKKQLGDLSPEDLADVLRRNKEK